LPVDCSHGLRRGTCHCRDIVLVDMWHQTEATQVMIEQEDWQTPRTPHNTALTTQINAVGDTETVLPQQRCVALGGGRWWPCVSVRRRCQANLHPRPHRCRAPAPRNGVSLALAVGKDDVGQAGKNTVFPASSPTAPPLYTVPPPQTCLRVVSHLSTNLSLIDAVPLPHCPLLLFHDYTNFIVPARTPLHLSAGHYCTMPCRRTVSVSFSVAAHSCIIRSTPMVVYMSSN
jgi:hypothetical protein